MSNEIIVTKREDIEQKAEEERRLEIRYLRHLKRKYPDEDKKISTENKQYG